MATDVATRWRLWHSSAKEGIVYKYEENTVHTLSAKVENTFLTIIDERDECSLRTHRRRHSWPRMACCSGREDKGGEGDTRRTRDEGERTAPDGDARAEKEAETGKTTAGGRAAEGFQRESQTAAAATPIQQSLERGEEEAFLPGLVTRSSPQDCDADPHGAQSDPAQARRAGGRGANQPQQAQPGRRKQATLKAPLTPGEVQQLKMPLTPGELGRSTGLLSSCEGSSDLANMSGQPTPLEGRAMFQKGGLKFSQDDVLGAGGFAATYRGTFNRSAVAVKVLSGRRCQSKEKEIRDIVAKADCSHIVKILEVMESSEAPMLERSLLIITELCDTNLREVLHSKRRAPSPRERRSLMVQVADGCRWIASKGLVHQDIKMQAILLKIDTASPARRFVAKIADLGLARASFEGISAGLLVYRAPETLHSRPRFSERSDVFSFAMVMLGCFRGAEILPRDFHVSPSVSPPGRSSGRNAKQPQQERWDYSIRQELMKAVMDGKRPEMPRDLEQMGKISSCIRRSWSNLARERPHFQELHIQLQP